MQVRTAFLLSMIVGTPMAAQSPVRGSQSPRGGYIAVSPAPIQRAVIGINVYTGGESDEQKGYPITSITPGSPADRAGLRTGDYVTRVDGRPLASPAVQLWLLQSRLGTDDTVSIEYRRGDVRRTVHLVPMLVNEMPMDRALRELRSGEPMPMPEEWPQRVMGYRFVNPGSPLVHLELAPLNPDLGRYFGSSDGVLVISAPPESSLGLRGGDVVISVDGRRPDSPSNLIRILRSYAPEDSIRFEVLRAHKRHVVVGQLR